MKTFKQLKFKVFVNSFFRTAEITHKDETIEMNFETLDEWNAFKMNGKDFDIHFHYDEEFSVSIYDVQDGQINTDNWHSVKLKLKM
jgi:hypothetical protein